MCYLKSLKCVNLAQTGRIQSSLNGTPLMVAVPSESLGEQLFLSMKRLIYSNDRISTVFYHSWSNSLRVQKATEGNQLSTLYSCLRCSMVHLGKRYRHLFLPLAKCLESSLWQIAAVSGKVVTLCIWFRVLCCWAKKTLFVESISIYNTFLVNFFHSDEL